MPQEPELYIISIILGTIVALVCVALFGLAVRRSLLGIDTLQETRKAFKGIIWDMIVYSGGGGLIDWGLFDYFLKVSSVKYYLYGFGIVFSFFAIIIIIVVILARR